MSTKELEDECGKLTIEINKLQRQRKNLIDRLYKEKAKAYIPEKDCSHRHQSLDLRDEYRCTFVCDECGKTRYNSFL